MSELRLPGDCGPAASMQPEAAAGRARAAMAGRGASTVQLHSRCCGLELAGVPSDFSTHLCGSLTVWETEIFSVDACRLCVKALEYSCVAMPQQAGSSCAFCCCLELLKSPLRLTKSIQLFPGHLDYMFGATNTCCDTFLLEQ